MIDRQTMENEVREKILKNFFISENPLVLRNMPSKHSKQRLVLEIIAGQFAPDKFYGAQEMDILLEKIYPDFASLRRALVDYQFLDRTPDGRQYWLKTE